MQRLVGVAIEVGNEDLGERRTHVTTAGQYRADRLHQFLGSAVLRQIATCAGPQHVDRILLFGQAAHDQNANPRMAGLNVTQYVQATSIRHVDVEKHEIPFLLTQQIERLVAARRLADGIDGRVRLQKLFESGPDDGVIVGDQYS
jgi:hypothetical protein